MNIDPTTTKYLISARIVADGIVEKPDVVGAIFGQTEGLIGDELDLRDLQKSGRMGRIEVELESKKGKSEGSITMPSSLDQVETAILASALETIDRVGPCKAKIEIEDVEDVRAVKKNKIIERAKELLAKIMSESLHNRSSCRLKFNIINIFLISTTSSTTIYLYNKQINFFKKKLICLLYKYNVLYNCITLCTIFGILIKNYIESYCTIMVK